MGKKLLISRGDCGCSSVAATADVAPGIELRPSSFGSLFGSVFGDTFLLICPPHIRSSIRLIDDIGPGCEVAEFAWDGPQPRRELIDRFRDLQRAGRSCSALWLGDDEFQHFLPAQLKGIKLAGISFFSNRFTNEAMSRFLKIVTETDYTHELKIEEQFLELIQTCERIIFRSRTLGTEAAFEHHQAEHWFSMHGPLEFGQQSVLPTGELATLTDASGDFDFHSRFEINGELVLKGAPVVHRGNRDVSLESTLDEYRRLAPMREFPVVLNVSHGFIENIGSPVGADNPFLDELARIFAGDQQYRKIHEVGFGTNPRCDPLYPANFFPNERYPGVHFGLGLGGATDFHLDLVSSDLDILCEFADGERVDLYQRLGYTCSA